MCKHPMLVGIKLQYKTSEYYAEWLATTRIHQVAKAGNLKSPDRKRHSKDN